MEMNYEIKKVADISQGDFDGIILISHSCSEKTIPEKLKSAVSTAAKIDKLIHEEVSVLPVSLPAKKLIYSPTGPLNSDYHDVRSFGEAAKKGVLRALKAGVTKPLLVLIQNERFPKTHLVTLLGALEALYLNLQHRELRPEVDPKVKIIGVWSDDLNTLAKIIETGKALECGRIVARDIGGPDPERMSPPNVEAYVKKVFASTDIKMEVISDEKTFLKEYPLFEAVNRAASVIERHRGRIIYLTYEGTDVKKTLFLVGKGVTYDTGGADIKAGGIMAGMSRDKCGAAAVAGFMKVLSYLKPPHLKVVGALGMVRNSVGENCYVSDEIILSRAGKIVRVGNTDAEGRMIMADILCKAKEQAINCLNPHLMTIATLTGHAVRTVGEGYSIAMDNGPANKIKNAIEMQSFGENIGDMLEVSYIRREDFCQHKGKVESEDVLQANNKASVGTNRGHQAPAAFLILASGLDKHGLDSDKPLPYTHCDIAGAAGDVPNAATGAPILLLSNAFIGL